METTQSQNRILETAWHRYAQLDANAISAQKRYIRLKRAMTISTVLAVLFAILVDNYNPDLPSWGQITLRILLILTPIITSAITAFTNKFQQGQRYLTFRAAAEEILREIFLYRTVLKTAKGRNKWLSDRLAATQRKMFRAVGGELVLSQYKGDLPPYYDPSKDYSDSGFNDLSGDEYVACRLEDQLAWHIKGILKLQKNRKRLQWLILAFAGGGTFLAAWGGPFVVWVTLTSVIVSSLAGWEELRGLDLRVANYSHVVLELNIIRDQWLMLDENMRTKAAVIKMVRDTEQVLWTQNTEFVNAMRKALADADGKEEELIQHVIEEARESTEQIKETLYTEVEEPVDDSMEEAVATVEESIEAATDGSLHQMSTGMRSEEVAPEDFVDEYFGEDEQKEIFVDEEPSDEDFVDEVWVDDEEEVG